MTTPVDVNVAQSYTDQISALKAQATSDPAYSHALDAWLTQIDGMVSPPAGDPTGTPGMADDGGPSSTTPGNVVDIATGSSGENPPDEIAGNAFAQLQDDLISGTADAAKIKADSLELAHVAGLQNDQKLVQVATLTGAGFYGDPKTALTALSNVDPDNYFVFDNSNFDPLNGNDTELNEAYLGLATDIATNKDAGTITKDADTLQSVAVQNEHPTLGSRATDISRSETESPSTYDAENSLPALMDNGPQLVDPAATNGVGGTPNDGNNSLPDTSGNAGPPPDYHLTDEQKKYVTLLLAVIDKKDTTTIVNDSIALTEAALDNQDLGTSNAALDIGQAAKDNNFDPTGAALELGAAAPGASGAALPPVGDDLPSAFKQDPF